MGTIVLEKVSSRDRLKRSPIFVFAADALAAAGMQGLGVERFPELHYRTRPEFLQLCRDMVKDGYLDGLLMTPADAEVLAVEERLFDTSPITPMVRMNAETNIWSPRHGEYKTTASLPFQTVPVEEAGYCTIGAARSCHVRMGLYSITLNNNVEADQRTLNAYLSFAREVGEIDDFDHFLEVFLPNVNLPGLSEQQVGEYVADSIHRTMSYLRRKQRPLWIKTQFTTPAVWHQLCEFDPSLIIGALGGARESARKTLQLAADVVKYGGQVILFGRTVFTEDSPRLIAKYLRAVLDGQMSVDDAHAAYQREVRETKI